MRKYVNFKDIETWDLESFSILPLNVTHGNPFLSHSGVQRGSTRLLAEPGWRQPALNKAIVAVLGTWWGYVLSWAEQTARGLGFLEPSTTCQGAARAGCPRKGGQGRSHAEPQAVCALTKRYCAVGPQPSRDSTLQQPQAWQGDEVLLPLGSLNKGCRRQSCGVKLRGPDRTGNRQLHSIAQGRAEGPHLTWNRAPGPVGSSRGGWMEFPGETVQGC